MFSYFKILFILFPFLVNSQIKRENLSQKDFTYWDFKKTLILSSGSYYVDKLGLTKDKHGEWIYYDKSGNVVEKSQYYRGVLDGKVIMYYSNGKLKQEGYFKKKLKEGVNTYISYQDSIYREWYETGTLEEEGMFKNDRKVGIWKYYYLNGQIKSHEEEIDSLVYIRNFWTCDSAHTQTITNGTGEMLTFHTTSALKELYNYKNGLPDGPFEDHSIYGYITLKGFFKEGKKDGEWNYYYYTGDLEKTSTYSKDVLNGPYKYYYDKNRLNVTGTYYDGKKSGVWKWYTNTNTLDMQGTFVNDLQDGEWSYFYPTGEKSYIAYYTKGLKSGSWMYWYKDGSTFKKGDFLNDEKNGRWQTWYEDGTLLMDGVYAEGKEEGEWLNYWDNGKLKNSVVFKAGLMNGEWKSFFPTGHLKMTGFYKSNFKSGKWINYYDNGLPKDMVTYKVMDVESKVEYGIMKERKVKESVLNGYSVSYSNKDYKMTEEGKYKNGQKDGEWKEYYPGGTVTAFVLNYQLGELHGPMREYSRTGEVKSETNYSKGNKHGSFKVYNESGKIIVEKTFDQGEEVKISKFK